MPATSREDQTKAVAVAVGVTLIGFGAPFFAVGVMLLKMVFLPGRGRIAPFSPHHPAFIVGASLIGAGALLVAPGWLLVRRVAGVRGVRDLGGQP